jgi:glutathionylspermidine synthase
VDLPTWRQLLPETVDPTALGSEPGAEWVLKPAFGRVGDGIGIAGATPWKEWEAIRREVRRRPQFWIAQRRFDTLAIERQGRTLYPCLGVYTVGGRAAGAYARLGPTLRIDQHATEAAVLMEREGVPRLSPEGGRP